MSYKEINNKLTSADLLKNVKRIEIKTKKVVNDYLAGEYHSIFKGRGIEFDEVREYAIGDDVRQMDWKVSARYGKPFVKHFKEERELTVTILADFSASTHFGSIKEKRHLIAEIAALLSFSAIKNNDKVSLIIFTDIVEKFIPARKGRNHTLKIIRELIDYSPKNKNTNIEHTLEYFNKIAKRKNVVFLITDICSDISKSQNKEFIITNKKHDFIVVLTEDNFEYNLKKESASVFFEDTETDDSSLVDLSKNSTLKSFLNEQRKLKEKNIDTLKKNFIDYIVLNTNEDYVAEIVKFFKTRNKR